MHQSIGTGIGIAGRTFPTLSERAAGIRSPRPLMSIVIPTWNSESTLPQLLRSVHEQHYRDHEIVVVDKVSTDFTVQIAQKHHCRVIIADTDRSEARNIGARKATGELLLFLDADMEVTPHVLEDCVAQMKSADGLCIKEITSGGGYWARVRAFERSHYHRSSLFEAARCFWYGVFDILRGYDPAVTGLEDYDLHARFLEAGFRLGWCDTPIVHHEENLGLRSYMEKRKYYGHADRTYAARHPDRWRAQRSVLRRARYVSRGPFHLSDLSLLPGLAMMRGIECLVRS